MDLDDDDENGSDDDDAQEWINLFAGNLIPVWETNKSWLVLDILKSILNAINK